MKTHTLVFSAVLAACAPTNDAPPKTLATEAPLAFPVARFLPPKDDVVLSYKTQDIAAGTSGVAMMRVVRRGEGHADITGGPRPSSVIYEEKGIRRVPEDTYLLVWPATVGRSWPVGAQATASIRKIDATVTVLAGTFKGCIEVAEERKAASATVVTTLCPDVGIVLLEAEGTGKNGAAHERMELQSATKAVSIDDVK